MGIAWGTGDLGLTDEMVSCRNRKYARLALCYCRSYSFLDYPVEDVLTLAAALAGLLLIGLLVDWLRKKIGRYPTS
jgi:hypothetical protein